MRDDVLEFGYLQGKIFDEVKTAAKPVIYVRSKERGEVLRFVLAPAEPVSNHHHWPTGTWRGQPTA